MNKNKKMQAAAPPLSGGSSFSGALSWGAMGWLVFVLLKYWRGFSLSLFYLQDLDFQFSAATWGVILKDTRALLLLAAVLWSAFAFGRRLLGRFRFADVTALESSAFSTGLGLGILAYAMFALGAVGLYRPAVFWGLLTAGLVHAALSARGDAGAFRDRLRSEIKAFRRELRGTELFQALLLGVLALSLMMCFVPEVFYDAMVYHIGIPRWWLTQGGIRYYPSIFGQYPFTRQMLNLFGLALEGERLAKLLHWSSAPLMLLTYAALARRASLPRAGLLSALVFFSMPMVHMNLWTTGVDVGMASFALLAAFAMINAHAPGADRNKWLLLSGIFAGLTFGSKYPGVVVGACLAAAFGGGLLWKERGKGGFKFALLFGAPPFLLILPWIVKNWVLTGNPLYPYFFKRWGGKGLIAEKLAIFHQDVGQGAAHSLADVLTAPWRATFGSLSSLSAPGVLALGAAGFLALGFRQKQKEGRPWLGPLLAFVLSYHAILLSLTSCTRLAIPGLAILSAAAGVCCAAVYERGSAIFKIIFSAVFFLSAAVGYDATLGIIFNNYRPSGVLTGAETEADYLSVSRLGLDPNPAGAAFEFARRELPANTKLLIVGDEKVSFCPVPFSANGVFDDQLITVWSKASRTPAELFERFSREKITHVLINWGECVRLRSYGQFPWSDDSLAVFCAFWQKHVRLVQSFKVDEKFFRGQVVLALYEVLPEAEAARRPTENANPLLDLYEEMTAPRSQEGWQEKRRDMLEKIREKQPGIVRVENELDAIPRPVKRNP